MEIIVPNHHTASSSQAENSQGSIALLRLLIARHPYASMVFFLVYWLALLLALGRVLAPIYFATHIPYLLYDLIPELALALVVVLPLVLLRWWSETGFTRGINGNGLVVCLLPTLLLAGPAVLGFGQIAGQASVLAVIAGSTFSLLVGFAEEGMFRGVLLRTLLPAGIWPAVIISALCFGCVHLTNLLSGASPAYVGGQLILAFGTGVLFATLRLRTGSIWPCILLHASRDVIGLIYFGIHPEIIQATPSATSNIYNIIFCLIYLAIAAVLLRPTQLRKLEITYGLVKEPAPVLSYLNPTPYSPGYSPYQQPPTPYPTYANQPQPTVVPANPPAPPQNAAAYQDYTSPAAYRETPAAETLTPESDSDGKNESV